MVHIPFSNREVFKLIEQGNTIALRLEVKEWFWDNFPNCQFDLTWDCWGKFGEFAFLQEHQGLMFKLRWGGQ